MAVGNEQVLATTAQELVEYATRHHLIEAADRVWAYNAVLAAVGAEGPAAPRPWTQPADEDQPADQDADGLTLDDLLNTLVHHALMNGVIERSPSACDALACQVMGALTPRPSEVARQFHALESARGPKAATDWFYALCCANGYVRQSAIARNIKWKTPTTWGDLEITINLSKPEKDPRAIARAGAAPQDGERYPACQLCIENEGYAGRGDDSPRGAHPARQNLRIVPLELGGERWGLQYSPYAYFGEHCIAMSASHRPMHIDRATVSNLLELVDLLPHYFFGSNADLPIVGGSILSHDHFQGGAHEFAMMRAATAWTFAMDAFPDVSAEVLHWPLSVIRLRARSREQALDAAVHVIDLWRGWSSEAAGVIAAGTDGAPHNTVTPVVRRVGEAGQPGGAIYEVYLALRCNVTSEEHPLGVFHPHAQYHHIKRENIGLIEVMGLAILPPRLSRELAEVSRLLEAGQLDALDANPLTASHAAWARVVAARRGADVAAGKADAVLQDEVGQVFSHVLEDAGVFKWNEAGEQAFHAFTNSL